MTIRTAHCSALVLIACTLIVPHARAGTTFIDFNPNLGHLANDQDPPGVLTGANNNSTNNKGVFSGTGVAYLHDGSRVLATNEVSLTIKLNVITDTGAGDNNNAADICMFIADADFPADAITACFDGFLHPSTGELTGLSSNISLGINLPGTTDDYTLVYDPVQDKATLSRANTPTSVSVFNALNGAQTFVMGLVTDGGPIQLRQFTATGDDIPDFPVVGDPLDPDNPWLDFGVSSGGNGAQSDPFNTLANALSSANPGATVSINPGTDSTETPTINQNVTLANANAAGGSVSIGVPTRSNADRSGFVSRRRPQNE